MIGWAYCRVSGDDQADKGLPVAGQRDAIRRHAAEHDITIDRWFVDEAMTGGNDQRDQFQYMMVQAHQDPAPCEVILFWAWSRFARNPDDAHYWKASLRRHGVDFIDVSGEIPDNLPPGFKYVFEALIHWKDAQKLVEQSVNARRGQQTLARLGYIPSGCNPPRGYKVEFKEAIIEGRKRQVRRWVPDIGGTWEPARLAWEMRLRGKSYREIADATHLYRSTGSWSVFFGNRSYVGQVDFGGTLVPIEPLVTEAEFAYVNRNRHKPTGGAGPRVKGSSYLLSGKLRCGLCGAPMCGDSSSAGVRNDGHYRKRYRFYTCTRHKRGQCTMKTFSAVGLEAAVMDSVMDDILTSGNVDRQRALLANQMDDQRETLRAQLATLNHELANHQRAVANLLDAIEAAPASRALIERLREHEIQRDDTERKKLAIQHQLDHPPELEDIDVLRRELQDAIDQGQVRAARAMLDGLIDHIVVHEGTLQVRYRLAISSF